VTAEGRVSLISKEDQRRVAEAIRRGKLTHRQLEKEMGRELSGEERFALTHVIPRPKYYLAPR
jgi:dephospho-CoA kinase